MRLRSERRSIGRPVVIAAVGAVWFGTACSAHTDGERPYDEVIAELVCLNPGTTAEEMDAAARDHAARENRPVEDVAVEALDGAREELEISGPSCPE